MSEATLPTKPSSVLGNRGALLWLVVIGGLLVALYGETIRRMVVQWASEEDYNHGFVVPLFSAWLIWQERERLRALSPSTTPWAAAVLAGALLIYLVGFVGAELFLQRLSIVIALVGLILLFLGRAWTRALAFPLGFLVFAIPIPAVIRNLAAFPLQLFAAKTATFCLSGVGIPVFREGNVIVLAQTTLEVVDACSGLRSLQALLALAVVYAYLSQSRWWKRAVLVLAAVPVAIGANAFRVTGTGILAHFLGLEAAQGFYHSLAGYLMFGVAFLGLLLVGLVLNRLAPDAVGSSALGAPGLSQDGAETGS